VVLELIMAVLPSALDIGGSEAQVHFLNKLNSVGNTTSTLINEIRVSPVEKDSCLFS
jgi:hypothetical protein